MDSFKLGVKEGLAKCRQLKLDGIELTDIPGELTIEHLTGTEAKGLKDLIAFYGLEINSTCGDLSGHEYTDESDVDFPKYLKALDEICFKGFHIIEWEVGANPVTDIAKAPEFLRRF